MYGKKSKRLIIFIHIIIFLDLLIRNEQKQNELGNGIVKEGTETTIHEMVYNDNNGKYASARQLLNSYLAVGILLFIRVRLMISFYGVRKGSSGM